MHPSRHILWITGRYPPLGGGMSTSCERQVRGLRARGHRVDVLAFVVPSSEPGIERIPRDGGTDYLVSRDARPGQAGQLAFRTVLEAHRTIPFTHLVGFGAGSPGFLAVTFAAWLDRPSVVLVRGNDFDRDWFEPRLGFLVREALARANVIGAVSPDAVSRIRRLFPGSKVRFTPNAVDPDDWNLLPADRRRRDKVRTKLLQPSPGAGAGEGCADAGGTPGENASDPGSRRGVSPRIIGVFGEVKYKKRLPLLLGAIRDSGRCDEIALLLVGRVDDVSRQLLEDPVLAPRHERITFAPRDQLPGLYAACDFIALPSLYEGMPNVLLEAMAVGLVPLVSDAGAMGEVVEDGVSGFVFAPEDRDGLARTLTRALDLPPERYAAMSRRARARVEERFSPDRELDILEDLLAGIERTPTAGMDV